MIRFIQGVVVGALLMLLQLVALLAGRGSDRDAG